MFIFFAVSCFNVLENVYKKTRSHDSVSNILGESLDMNQHMEMNHSRLPSNKQVLLCLIANRAHLNKEFANQSIAFQAKRSVYIKIQEHYKRANLPIISQG